MALTDKISALATRVGTECKTLHGEIDAVETKVGDISTLTTTAKTSTVVAINELVTGLGATNTNVTNLTTRVEKVEGSVDSLLGNIIDDTAASTTKTYSSSKIESVVTAAKQAVKDDLLGGAGEAYDTLKELADLIDSNKTAIEALETIAGGAVRYDQDQSTTLTDEQKGRARTNIGAAASAEMGAVADLATTAKNTVVAAINEVNTNANKATTDAAAAQADVNTLTTNVGATDTNFVTVFETALTAA